MSIFTVNYQVNVIWSKKVQESATPPITE